MWTADEQEWKVFVAQLQSAFAQLEGYARDHRALGAEAWIDLRYLKLRLERLLAELDAGADSYR